MRMRTENKPPRGIGYWMNHPLVRLIGALLLLAIFLLIFGPKLLKIFAGHPLFR